jgi:hypothetical protein
MIVSRDINHKLGGLRHPLTALERQFLVCE